MKLCLLLLIVVISNVGGQVDQSGVQRRRDGRRIRRPVCFNNNRIYMIGQRFPSADGCNTCTCNGYNRISCTERACLPGPPQTDLCDLPSETGRCRAYIPSWYYDSREGRCKTFSYGGCGGNANRFATKDACQQRCGKEFCKLPPEIGPCDGLFPRWYYDSRERRCKQFIYGGCDGNANRFQTHAACQRRCGSEQVCRHGDPLPGRTCGGLLPGNRCPRGYTCVGELVPVDGPGVCCPARPESGSVCRHGRPLAVRTCGRQSPWQDRRRGSVRSRRRMRRQCPRGYECVGDSLAFGRPGVCCPTDSAQPHHYLCPRLNPFRQPLECFRFEECSREGCPRRHECCPTLCGTGCKVLRPPCGDNQPPLRDSFGRQLFCGRGPNRVDCPRGHYCSVDPADRYAVCCPYL